LYKGNLRKNLKEKNMRRKNKTLAIARFEPPISSVTTHARSAPDHATGYTLKAIAENRNI
jgi:hypothetical protein